MSLPPDYLRYPKRGYGMDHDRYDWSMLVRRQPVVWPSGARIALWIIPQLEWFPLDMAGKPFKPPGAMVNAYPDLRHYTLRDYGNRVGVFRVMAALERFGLKASVAVNAAVALRHPSLLGACVERGWEVIGHGWDMDCLHHEGLAAADEQRLVARSLDVLRRGSGQPVRGWLSPAKSESFRTLDLLAAAGVDYVCDWVNDDMPYALRAGGRTLHSLPHPSDIDDYQILIANHHTEDDFTHALTDHFDWLYREAATQGGRVMAIALNPWVIGQPYRIGALEAALAHITRHPGVWSATGAEILDAFAAQQ
jgi:peptidoglycan/xylan/chitin deacetylase (PgdA/CDA1 family)